MKMLPYELLLGKTGNDHAHLPLWMHLEDTAVVMEFLCKNRVPYSVIRAMGLERETFARVSLFLAMVHDLGKCTPLFAARILLNLPERRECLSANGLRVPDLSEYPSGGNISHALAGEMILRDFGCADGICSVVGAHHGKPTDLADACRCSISAYDRCFYANQEPLWREMQKRLLDEALHKSGYTAVEELPRLSHCAQMLLCGLVIQADWIASNQEYFPLLAADEAGEAAMYPRRQRQALERIALTDAWRADTAGKSGEELFYDRFHFMPNTVQKAAMALAQEERPNPGGLLLIEAQMGVGKTEAALAAAEMLAARAGCGGIFFGLPTQATSNGLFPRMSQWAKRVSQDGTHAIRLVHGMAELNEDYREFFRGKAMVEEDGNGGLTVHSWFSGRKQALLADFVVGTVDTALMSALRQKHVMLRHLGLCGKVVVIDECHAYDAYMSRFLLRMLQWLGAYQVPVILLSATLPNEKKREMLQAYSKPYGKGGDIFFLPSSEDYPLLTWADADGVRSIAIQNTSSSSEVVITTLTEGMLADALREHLSEGGCAGVIVNTVKRAQEIAEKLRQQLPHKRIYVYHAQFLAEERIRREKELMDRIGKTSTSALRDHVIIVGTQVLEQSLDIDFDYLISDLCPMDLLLQRMGRLHRHQRMRPAPLCQPSCAVLGTEEIEKGSARIYGEWLLRQTRRYLPKTIRLPDDIPWLVNSVYAEPCEAEQDDPAWMEFRNRTEIKENAADDWCLPRPKNSKRETRNSIVGLLDHYMESEKKAEASVRDGTASVDVLVLCRRDSDHVACLPWISETLFRCDTVPSEEEARQIALQRLRLPFVFGCGKTQSEVIEILERETLVHLAPWQESPWLSGELILLLDEKGERDLCGYHLCYEKEYGLRYERIGE
ncbi:MAG: CRISPR-associated helicase Cas3' [Clostridiales bacterium]|nr:CRISPR-associated helicase Cas3' [Candidatus Cacconaster stercorequi]